MLFLFRTNINNDREIANSFLRTFYKSPAIPMMPNISGEKTGGCGDSFAYLAMAQTGK
ncbi:hypothetical protein [Sphingobacterium deserti]|uniref:hypothetical protein n=1 Tax=Sphingobacterium deserti TaxID=1229276 RepID=UPI000AD1A3DE|nr:hypothetical protein [Sphingobacterium deserti]